jgi:hypothetical protein
LGLLDRIKKLREVKNSMNYYYPVSIFIRTEKK